MKTLDEVIESITKQSGLEIRNIHKPDKDRFWVDRETYNDALFYLKEYRWIQENCADTLAEKYPSENVPLTWEQLKTMEGKPVWVEYGIGFNQKRWVIIYSFHNTGSFCYMNVSGNYPNTFWQKDMGEDEFWKAYRKERS